MIGSQVYNHPACWNQDQRVEHNLIMKKLSINLLLSYSSTVVGFLIILLLARAMGAENFSWVALGLAIGGFIVPLLNLGSDRTFVRDAVVRAQTDTIDKMALANLSPRLFMVLPISVILVSLTLLFTDSINDAISLTGFSLWAGLIGLYPASWFDYSHDVRRQNLIVLSERAVSLLLICGFYTYASSAGGILAISTCLLATRSFSIFLQIRMWWLHHASIVLRINLALPRQNTNGINFYITIATVANAFLTYGNQLLLATNNNPTELSSYSLAFQIIMIVFLFQSQAIRISSRSIMEACRSKGALLRSIISNSAILFIGSTILAFGAWVAIQLLPYFLADPRFETMSKIAIPLCIWVVLGGVGLSISQHSLALSQERFILLTSIIGGIIALYLGSLFIPDYGALSVAIILLIVHFSMILVNTMWLLYGIKSQSAWA